MARSLGSRLPRWFSAATFGLVAVAACAVTAVLDPSRSEAFPACPVRAVTGYDCPGCGTLRGLHALFGGDPVEALDRNVLLAVAIPAALYAYAAWLLRGFGVRLAVIRLRPAVLVAVAAVVGAFTVVRNLPPELLPPNTPFL